MLKVLSFDRVILFQDVRRITESPKADVIVRAFQAGGIVILALLTYVYCAKPQTGSNNKTGNLVDRFLQDFESETTDSNVRSTLETRSSSNQGSHNVTTEHCRVDR